MGLFGISAIAAFLGSAMPVIAHFGISTLINVRGIGGLLGGFIIMLALSWFVAGAVYLVSWGRVSREGLAIACVITSGVVGYFSYLGIGT
jgi:hypothetical protein